MTNVNSYDSYPHPHSLHVDDNEIVGYPCFYPNVYPVFNVHIHTVHQAILQLGNQKIKKKMLFLQSRQVLEHTLYNAHKIYSHFDMI